MKKLILINLFIICIAKQCLEIKNELWLVNETNKDLTIKADDNLGKTLLEATLEASGTKQAPVIYTKTKNLLFSINSEKWEPVKILIKHPGTEKIAGILEFFTEPGPAYAADGLDNLKISYYPQHYVGEMT